MKKFFIVCTLLASYHFSNAQFSETKMNVDSLNVPALVLETDFPKGDVADVLDKYFDDLNAKREKGKGFEKNALKYVKYKRANIAYIMGTVLDYYFTIDTKKQKGPDVTVVNIAASQGYNNFIDAKSESWANLSRFAEYLKNNLFERARITGELATLNKDLKRTKDKLSDIEKNKAKLEKEKEETEKAIADKTTQVSTLEGQLESLKKVGK